MFLKSKDVKNAKMLKIYVFVGQDWSQLSVYNQISNHVYTVSWLPPHSARHSFSSARLFVCLGVCFFVWVFVNLFGCLFVSLGACFFVWVLVSLFGCLFVWEPSFVWNLPYKSQPPNFIISKLHSHSSNEFKLDQIS